MHRNRPTPDDLQRIKEYRLRQQNQRAIKSEEGLPSPGGMSLDDIKKMLKGAGRSGHKIPKTSTITKSPTLGLFSFKN
jgi:hypothetical protein